MTLSSQAMHAAFHMHILISVNFINPDRDMGVKAIENLMKKKGKFDYVLLETTGLADPGPIASVFWMDEQLCSDLYLDGMLTIIIYP